MICLLAMLLHADLSVCAFRLKEKTLFSIFRLEKRSSLSLQTDGEARGWKWNYSMTPSRLFPSSRPSSSFINLQIGLWMCRAVFPLPPRMTPDLCFSHSWDREAIQLLQNLAPRETGRPTAASRPPIQPVLLTEPFCFPVLFVADAKMSFDDFRSSMVATVNSKSVVTVNPGERTRFTQSQHQQGSCGVLSSKACVLTIGIMGYAYL